MRVRRAATAWWRHVFYAVLLVWVLVALSGCGTKGTHTSADVVTLSSAERAAIGKVGFPVHLPTYMPNGGRLVYVGIHKTPLRLVELRFNGKAWWIDIAESRGLGKAMHAKRITLRGRTLRVFAANQAGVASVEWYAPGGVTCLVMGRYVSVGVLEKVAASIRWPKGH